MAWELYALWRFAGRKPAEVWRQWRRLPPPADGVEPYPSRIQAFEAACAIHAAGHERTVSDIAAAFQAKQG